ncbi:MAG TPA: hypothetical protein VFB60_27220, partial [Ktedonobacteraceae bacterium]|nr:hypothetical protein [Ktedonobacteraceae bacterium]
CCKVGNTVCQAGVKGAAASLRGVGCPHFFLFSPPPKAAKKTLQQPWACLLSALTSVSPRATM